MSSSERRLLAEEDAEEVGAKGEARGEAGLRRSQRVPVWI